MGLTVASAACNPLLGFLFSTLCDLVKKAGLEDTLSDPEGTFTVFAPTNSAFENLPKDTLNAVLNDVDLLKSVLLFHTVSGQDIKAKELVDGNEISMANGGTSTTTRPRKHKIFQSGPGNDPKKLPMIIIPNVPTSNGITHAIKEVLLPQHHNCFVFSSHYSLEHVSKLLLHAISKIKNERKHHILWCKANVHVVNHLLLLDFFKQNLLKHNVK